MSIINLNDDSFFENSRLKSIDKIYQFIDSAILNNSTIIDIGAVSSRPFAADVSEEEELKRLIPVLKQIRSNFPDIFISVDTWRKNVAIQVIDEGANMINDIKAGKDPGMIDLIGLHNIPYIMMHMKGVPSSMQIDPNYENVSLEVLTFLIQKKELLNKSGAYQLVIDPGFGFGKTIEDNFQLLKKLNIFKILDAPILAGISRKSMIYKTLGNKAEQALNGTSALNMFALLNGAKILRVHDPKEANEVVKLYDKLLSSYK